MNEEKLNQFFTIYEKHLARCVSEGKYSWTDVSKVPEVAAKMREATARGTYNHDGPAYRATCKELGIKHTRKAISAFLERTV